MTDSLEQPPSEAVVTAVAEVEGVAPHELSEPLFSAVDPDALDTLIQRSEVTVTFRYHGYRVTVNASGEVVVDPVV